MALRRFSGLGIAAAGPGRPLHTYSIVARDPISGAFGVAVQSHWFSVGATVPWAQAGVGAVATQSFVDVSYGPNGLALMQAGRSAEQALETLLAQDSQRDLRQVAMVDRQGRIAAWTGPRCVEAAGHQTGPAFSVQANLMDRPTVWPAMAEAYRQSAGRPFAERLLLALETAEREGGDARGRQSAALLIVKGEGSGRSWGDGLFDLRVEDHPEPLAELRRLYELQLAYDELNAGDEALAADQLDLALARYAAAAKLAPDSHELSFWHAVALFRNGHEQEALAVFKRVFRADSRWLRVVPRLAKAGQLPLDERKIQQILGAANRASAPGRGPAPGAR